MSSRDVLLARVPVAAAVAVVLLLILSGWMVLGFGTAGGTSRVPIAPAGTALAPSAETGVAAIAEPTAVVHPASSASNFTGPLFFNLTNSFASPSVADQPCDHYGFPPYFDNYCYSYQQQPTILNLGNGDMGVGYSAIVNTTNASCPVYGYLYGAQLGSRVAFALSSDNGSTFGSPQYLGATNCTYPQAIEPTFALGADGVIDGAFVAANYTYDPIEYSGSPDRPGDALVFVNSTDHGVTFSSEKFLDTSGNIAYPEMATFGDTIYIVYENVSNGTALIPSSYYASSYPSELEFIYSTDGGTTWSRPVVLPGENATANDLAMGPSIATSSTGEVAVAYATNYSCVAFCGSFYGQVYGLDVVVVTSSTNGTSWSPIRTIATEVGSIAYASFSWGMEWIWQFTPTTQIAFSPSGGSLYVAWVGAYNTTNFNEEWYNAGLFAAASVDNGVTWTVAAVEAQFSPTSYYQDGFINPGLAVAPDGTIYLTYLWQNGTYSYGGCGVIPDFLDGLTYQALSTSTDGVHWSSPTMVGMQSDVYETYTSGFAGWTSSVTFSDSGAPVIAYSQPQAEVYSDTYWGGNSYYNSTDFTNLTVATVYSGPTVTVEFNETGLPAGTPWSAVVNLHVFTSTESSLNISGIPLGVDVYLAVPPSFTAPSGASWGSSGFYTYEEWSSYDSFTEFNVSYGQLFPLYLFAEPSQVIGYYVDIYVGATCYEIDYYAYDPTPQYTPSLPWLIPNGSSVFIDPNPDTYDGSPPVAYWNGTGDGSYTGPGSYADLTMNGSPISETFWMAYSETVNQTIEPVGLSSSNTYTFSFDGQSYSAPGDVWTTFTGIPLGPHSIGNITATSSQAGYVYYGYASSGPTVVAPLSGPVFLHFALVDTSSTSGQVSFQATGLDPATTWTLSFNGTTYSSNTTWINVTAQSGTYDAMASASVALSAATNWSASGFGPQLSVTPGSTYTVAFSPTYRFSATATTGGKVTGGAVQWVLPGTMVTINATPLSGYRFVGWTGVGATAYSGPTEVVAVTVTSPTTESAAFAPLPNARFNLTFSQTTLPVGQWWAVDVGGVGYASNTGEIVVPGLYATTGSCTSSTPTAYALHVSDVVNASTAGVRYVPASYPPYACTTGTTVVSLTFTTQYDVSVQASNGGTATVSTTHSPAGAAVWAAPSDVVTITAGSLSGFRFLGWQGTGAGSYSGPQSFTTFSASGPVTETAVFAPIVVPVTPTFAVNVSELSSLAPGTSWSITLGTKTFASSGSTLLISGLPNGTYPLSAPTVLAPGGLVQYAPSGLAPHVVIQGANATVSFGFTTSYWVSVAANAGGTVSPASGWVSSGRSITLTASPNDGYTFVGWVGTGVGSFTGADASTTLTVNGTVTEVAQFQPNAVSSTTTTSTGFWNSDGGWIGLALIGLIAGLVVGLLAMRLRRPPAAGSSTDTPATTGVEEYVETANPPAETEWSEGGTP